MLEKLNREESALTDALLKTRNIFKIEVFDTIDSTNAYLVRMAKQNAPEWQVAIALRQTAGRGRHQRKWESLPNLGLYFSILLRPKLEARFLNLINLFTAYQLADFLERQFLEVIGKQITIDLKWPNDLLAGGKKLSGILLEAAFTGNQPDYVVVGIGVNVNHHIRDFPSRLQTSAQSMKMLSEHKWQPMTLAAGFLDDFHQNYHYYFPENYEKIHQLYKEKMIFLNENIVFNDGIKGISGKLIDITPEGYLHLEQDGKLRVITSGDIFGASLAL